MVAMFAPVLPSKQTTEETTKSMKKLTMVEVESKLDEIMEQLSEKQGRFARLSRELERCTEYDRKRKEPEYLALAKELGELRVVHSQLAEAYNSLKNGQ